MKSAQFVLDTLADYYIPRGVQVLKLPVLPMLSSVVYYRRKIVVGTAFHLPYLKLTYLILHNSPHRACH